MNPPKCKVCGFVHWSGAPHYSGSTAIAASVIPVAPRLPRIPVSDTPPDNTVVVPSHDISFGPVIEFATQAEFDAAKKAAADAAAAKRPRGRPISPEPKSPRAEYQRKLMRKRRAAAKEAKP